MSHPLRPAGRPSYSLPAEPGEQRRIGHARERLAIDEQGRRAHHARAHARAEVALDARVASRPWDIAFFGVGERSNAVDQRGVDVEHWVEDGPWQAEERPFRDTRRRRYDLQAALGFRPWALTLGGRRLGARAWSFSEGALRATFRVRSGRLVAKSRC